MKKFEYIIRGGSTFSFSDLVDILNDFGNEGWELVSWELKYDSSAYHPYSYKNATFKREIQ